MPGKHRKGPPSRRHRSRQKKYGGGKFGSERQRKWMWAVAPRAAHKWAHNRKTNKSDWLGSKAKTRGRARVRRRRRSRGVSRARR